MRFKEFYLIERPYIQDRFGLLADKQEYWKYTVYNQMEEYKLEKIIDKNYTLRKRTNHNYVLVYSEGDVVYGVLHFDFIFNKKEPPYNYPKIGWTAIEPSRRGKNISSKFYDIVLDMYGGLLSDDYLTNRSLDKYISFSKKYNVYLLKKYKYSYEKIDSDFIKNYKNKPKEQSSDHLFVVSKKELNLS